MTILFFFIIERYTYTGKYLRDYGIEVKAYMVGKDKDNVFVFTLDDRLRSTKTFSGFKEALDQGRRAAYEISDPKTADQRELRKLDLERI